MNIYRYCRTILKNIQYVSRRKTMIVHKFYFNPFGYISLDAIRRHIVNSECNGYYFSGKSRGANLLAFSRKLTWQNFYRNTKQMLFMIDQLPVAMLSARKQRVAQKIASKGGLNLVLRATQITYARRFRISSIHADKMNQIALITQGVKLFIFYDDQDRVARRILAWRGVGITIPKGVRHSVVSFTESLHIGLADA